MGKRYRIGNAYSPIERKALGLRMRKRTELEMPIRPSKARPWDQDGKTYRIGNACSSIESKVLGLGWENVPNWECLFVHRKQGLGTRMGNVPNWECLFVHRKQGLGTRMGKNVPNWECLFVHRKQGLGTRMGKRTELGMPNRPSKARSWD